MIPNVLTIAGSDPGGGAGIQADLKTFSALGVFGTAVLTVLTAQNTKGVTGIHAVPISFIGQQIDTLFEDISIQAVKIGMVGTEDVAAVIANRLQAHGAENIVLDPVMVAKGGASLIDERAVEALKKHLIPMAKIITPNLPEGARLADQPTPASVGEMELLAVRLHDLGPGYVLLKGGHMSGRESVDLLFDGKQVLEFRAERIETLNTHGTGCTLSSALAAFLALGLSMEEAVREAKGYLTGAIRESHRLQVGHGHGPVHHFYRQW